VGVTIAGGSNPAKGNEVAAFAVATPDANMPVVALTRDLTDVDGNGIPGLTTVGGPIMIPVISLDPRAANAALISAAGEGPSATSYRGAFGPDENWLCGWTAADAYGFSVDPPGGCVIVDPCPSNPARGCSGDVNGDGQVDGADLGQLLLDFAVTDGCPTGKGDTAFTTDLNGDGVVDGADLGQLLLQFTGEPCP
jgi:hypothetical protein